MISEARINRVIEALEEKVTAYKFLHQQIELEMKVDGYRICVEPSLAYENGFDVWYAKDSVLTHVDSIRELAIITIEHPKKLNELLEEEKKYVDDNIPKLEKFYNERIKGRTEEDARLGWEVSEFAYSVYRNLENKPNYMFEEDACKVYIERFVKENPVYTTEQVKRALDYSLDYECYSDWYKEVYGVRPR